MNLRNVYDSRRIWKLALIAVSLILVAGFIWISNNLVKDLAKQERDRMEIWADATKELASMSNEPATDEQGNLLMPTDINFLFSIIERIFRCCWSTTTTRFCNTATSICQNPSTASTRWLCRMPTNNIYKNDW